MKVSFLFLFWITQFLVFSESSKENGKLFGDLKSQFESLQSAKKFLTPEVIRLAIKIKEAMEISQNSKKLLLQLNMLKSELPLSVQGMIWNDNLFSVKDTKWRFEIINDIEIRMKADGVGRNLKASGGEAMAAEPVCVLKMIPQDIKLTPEEGKILEEYASNFSLNFKTTEEKRDAIDNIIKAKTVIDESNKLFEQGLRRHKLSLQEFSHLSEEEFSEKYLGMLAAPVEASRRKRETLTRRDCENLPESLNWVDLNRVSKVKDQGGQCNSCYIFSSTGAVESAVAVEFGIHPPKLSVQQTLDCLFHGSSENRNGCQGGRPEWVWKYVRNQNGFVLETSDNKYKGHPNDQCQIAKTVPYTNVDHWERIFFTGSPEEVEEQMKCRLATTGPLHVSLNFKKDDLGSYESGIYMEHGSSCHPSEPYNHGVLLVGYGETFIDGYEKVKYWIIQNSWSEHWGEQGYLFIERGKNVCNLDIDAMFPVLEKKLKPIESPELCSETHDFISDDGRYLKSLCLIEIQQTYEEAQTFCLSHGMRLFQTLFEDRDGLVSYANEEWAEKENLNAFVDGVTFKFAPFCMRIEKSGNEFVENNRADCEETAMSLCEFITNETIATPSPPEFNPPPPLAPIQPSVRRMPNFIPSSVSRTFRTRLGSRIEFNIEMNDEMETPEWRRTDGKPIPTGANFDKGKFIIEDVHSDADGTYELLIYDPSEGTQISLMTARLIVLDDDSSPIFPLENQGAFSTDSDYFPGNDLEEFENENFEPENSNPKNSEKTPLKVVEAKVGSMVSFRCSALSGSATYSWSRLQGSFPPGVDTTSVSLNLISVKASDAGIYICTTKTSNEVKEISTILEVTEVVPFFSQSPVSYMSFQKLPQAYSKFYFEITFRPENQNGLILYNGQGNSGGDFISLSLLNGFPQFRFKFGSQKGKVASKTTLSLGEWHTIKVNRVRNNGWMVVDDQDPVSFPDDLEFEGLNLDENLFLGGVTSFDDIPEAAVEAKEGFVGCISRLLLNEVEIQLMQDVIFLEGVSSCETCSGNLCENDGVCLEAQNHRAYACVCQDGFAGKNCQFGGSKCSLTSCGAGRCGETEFGFECFCPPNKTGESCQSDDFYVNRVLSFKENSFAAYEKISGKKNLVLKIRPETDQDGIILYAAESEKIHGDFFAVVVKDQHIECRYVASASAKPVVLRSAAPVKVNEWMKISVGRTATDLIFLQVDNEPKIIEESEENRGKNLYLNTKLYVGGFDKRIVLNRGAAVAKGFQGCIKQLEISGSPINMIHDMIELANVQNCENIIEKSASFQGDGFLELDRNTIADSSIQTSSEIYIWFTTTSSNGLIFWYGQPKEVEFDGQDFIALAVVDGFLEFSFRLDGEETVIKHRHVELETKHVAVIKRNENKAILELDGESESGETKATERKNMFLTGNLLLGGAPNIEKLTGKRFSLGFVGCIHEIETLDGGTIILGTKMLSFANIDECSWEEEFSPVGVSNEDSTDDSK